MQGAEQAGGRNDWLPQIGLHCIGNKFESWIGLKFVNLLVLRSPKKILNLLIQSCRNPVIICRPTGQNQSVGFDPATDVKLVIGT